MRFSLGKSLRDSELNLELNIECLSARMKYMLVVTST